MLSPTERTLRAKVAAFTLHSKVDGPAHTAPARRAFLATFEAQVDPAGTLSARERTRRAKCARNAHFQRLALKSAQSRRRKANGGAK